MGKVHEIGVGAETRAFEDQIKRGVIRPTEDAERALKKLGDTDAGRDAAKDVDRFEDALKDAQRQSERLERSMDDVNASSKRAFTGASENVQGFKQEAVQNFSEFASSADGSLQGVADGVQGLTGGLASSLTPGIGIPIAAVGALAGAFLQSWITAAEDSEERVSDMFDRMRESGRRYQSEEQIKEAIDDLPIEDVNKAIERSNELYIDQGSIIRAMVGDSQAIAGIQQVIADRRRAEVDAARESGVALEEQAVKIDAINTKYAEQTDWLRDIQNDTKTAGARWDAVKEAVDSTGEAVDLLKGKTQSGVTIPINVDRRNLDAAIAAYDTLQRRASRGISIAFNNTGRQLLQ